MFVILKQFDDLDRGELNRAAIEVIGPFGSHGAAERFIACIGAVDYRKEFRYTVVECIEPRSILLALIDQTGGGDARI